MRCGLLLLGLLNLFTFPLLGRAEGGSPQIREEIQGLLADRHPKAGADWWRGLGPQTPATILELLGEGPTLNNRIRLLQGLAWFDDPAGTAALKTEAETTTSSVVRNSAIRTLGLSQGPKELDYLQGYLKHPDVQTRYAAAEALKRMGDPGANEALRRYLAEEKAPWIAKKLADELKGPVGPIKPSASSEDRLSPDWAGKWEGLWIDLKKDASLEPLPAELVLELKGSTEVLGKMIVGRGILRTEYELKNGLGRARQWSATWVEKRSKATPKSAVLQPGPREVPLEATLSEELGVWIIRALSPKQGGTFVWVKSLRKGPPGK